MTPGDPISKARAVLSMSMPGPWRVAHHGGYEIEAQPNVLIADLGPLSSAPDDARAIALSRNCIESLLDVLEAARVAVWQQESDSAHEAHYALDHAVDVALARLAEEAGDV